MNNALIKHITLSFIITFTFISCQQKNSEIDITEIIEKAHIIADKYFSVDVSGIPYNSEKKWLVYNKTINNEDFNSLLKEGSKTSDSLEDVRSVYSDMKYNLIIKETERNKLIEDYKSIYKEENDYYLVRLNRPIKNKNGIYRTYIWINANKWRCGFHIYVEFKIEANKANVLVIHQELNSNVWESSVH